MNGAKPSLALVEAVRAACLEAAREGYESAAVSGLCHEGAVEASLDAIRMLDLKTVVAEHAAASQKKP
ncbi:MAG: acetyltransferase [Gammaproteobacteria bacterium]